MKYETSAEECKFDKRRKVKNRGSYLEDNCRENNVIEETIVNMWRYWDKSEKQYFCTNVTLLRVERCRLLTY